MAMHSWVRRILWIDGVGAIAAGTVVLGFRGFFAELYQLPLDLITAIGLVNLTYSAVALTLATQQRRAISWIAALAMANYAWAPVCALLAIRFAGAASALGLAHLVFEGAWVAILGTVEWRNRRELAGIEVIAT